MKRGRIRRAAVLLLACGLVWLAGCAPAREGADSHPSEADVYLLPVESLSAPREEAITHIVLHFTSDVRDNPDNPYDVQRILQIFREAEVSAHYLIGREGEVYPLIPEERVAWHAGKGSWTLPQHTDRLNQFSIGIELMGIGTREEMAGFISGEVYDGLDPALVGFTDAQYAALASLIADIRARHPAILFDREHILGHQEYRPEKPDPGALFDFSRIGL